MISQYDIYKKYKDAYDSDVQGCCLLIAKEIIDTIGGEPVAGELTWYSGSCRRTHWWVVKDGEIIDPMGEDLLSTEVAVGRMEVHRDINIFESLLPRYRRWKIDH